MAKTQNPRGAGGLDIFEDESVLGAFADATGSPEAAPVPPAPEVPKAENVVEMPQGPAPEEATSRVETARRAPPAPKRERRKVTAKPAPEPEVDAQPVVIEPNVGLKFRVPRSVKDDFGRFKADLGAALGVHLEDSNIGRAIIESFLVRDGERILVAAKEHYGEMKRPRNNDAVAMAEFDEFLGDVFQDARKRRKATPRDEG